MACPENKEDLIEDLPNDDDLDYGEGNGPLEGIETNIWMRADHDHL